MNMHAYGNDGSSVIVTEPVDHVIHYELEDRDGETFARLSRDDLSDLWALLPRGASETERGEIECYLCEIAEQDHSSQHEV